MSSTPIADLALLSDRRSSALVDRDGRVVWLSFPRHDSPSVLGHLLDERAGQWSVRPEGDGWTVSRDYLDRSLVLQTRWDGPDATLLVTDALCFGDTTDPHALGADGPHLLVRSVHCSRGTVDVAVHLDPAPEYGLVRPLLSPRPDGLLVRGGADQYRLSAPAPLEVAADGARARVRLRAASRCCSACSSAPRSRHRAPGPRTSCGSGWTSRSPGGSTGRTCTSATPGHGPSWSGTAAGYCSGWATHRPARSSRPPAPRCRSRSAAGGTGTTATHR